VGEVLVVCHATGFCGWAYEPLARELTGRFHVYAIDCRGHGSSSAPGNGSYDWRSMAGDLQSVLEQLSGGRPVVGFGHSLGGALLLHAEAAAPGLLGSAYLYEPIVLPEEELGTGGDGDRSGSTHLAMAARRRRRTFASKAEALYRYASRPPMSVLQAGALAAYVEHAMRDEPDGTAVLCCAPEDEAACYEAPGKPTYAAVRQVTVPVVVAIGATNPDLPPASFSLGLVEALPNARLERHRDLGHFGPLEAPKTVATALLAATGRPGR
jgi:pimeloyl-ACP methyl ester carboxylesterase